MTDRELMQQALDALEIYGANSPDVNQTITALRERLAQPEQEPVGDEWTPCMKLPVVVHVRKQRFGEAHVSTREGITPVKPDDLIMRGVSGEEYPIGRAIFEQTYSLNTTPPQPEQEPMAWEDVLGAIARGWTHDDNKHKTMDVQLAVAIAKEIQDMVIAPPQRKPMTDNELADLWYKQSLDWLEFARAIEAAHGIKES